MDLKEKAAIIHYHRHRGRECAGDAIGTLGYRCDESQTKRFAVLAAAVNVSGGSVLDVGCGHGDLKGYLDRLYHGFSYVGIDLMAEFVARARSLYGQRPSCYFCVADVSTVELPGADYVFASGLLCYRCSDPAFHLEMIARMYQVADKVLALNMLDATRFPEHPLLVGRDPDSVLRFCRTLCGEVQFIDGYLEDDFTIVMRKTNGD